MQHDEPSIRCGIGSSTSGEGDGGRNISEGESSTITSVSSGQQQHLQRVRSVVTGRRQRQQRNTGGTARGRHFVFTWNNYGADCKEKLIDLRPKYFCYQREIGERGTKHLQGVICFENARAFTAVARSIRGWHIEVMRGTLDQAIAYSTKEETRDPNFGEPETFGTRPRNVGRSGGRSDIDAVAQSIAEGGTVDEISSAFGGEFIKYHRGIERLIGLRFPSRDFKTEIRWYFGATGTGKTRAACDEAVNPYWKNPAHRWWDGYEGQQDVIIDDIRCDFAKFSEWLRLFDRYPVQVEVKGGTRNFISKRIFITAPVRPEEMWQSRTAEDLNQLMRRIEVIKHFGNHDFNPTLNDNLDEN
jgi:hypothetical protein